MPGAAKVKALVAVAGLQRSELIADDLAGSPSIPSARQRRLARRGAPRSRQARGAARARSERTRGAHAATLHARRVLHTRGTRDRAAPRARASASSSASTSSRRPASGVADAGEELQRFGRLRRADDADERREHAHGRAARLLELLALAEQAVVAGRVADRARRRPRSGRRSGSPRRTRAACARATQARLTAWRVAKVVAAVEHDVGAPQRAARARRRRRAAAIALDAHLGIDRREAARRGVDLARADVLRRVQDLPLQVGEVDRDRRRRA